MPNRYPVSRSLSERIQNVTDSQLLEAMVDVLELLYVLTLEVCLHAFVGYKHGVCADTTTLRIKWRLG
jgi:hypothetical protein